jgi:hypothetical protein
VQTREGGCDIVGLEWLSLEVKRVEQAGMIGAWWGQTLRQADQAEGRLKAEGKKGKDGKRIRVVPVLLHKQNYGQWKCRMRYWIEVGPGKRMLATFNVDIETFKFWFRERLRSELIG